MLAPSQIVALAGEAVPATLIGSTVILDDTEEVHAFASCIVKIASYVPELVYVLLAVAVAAVLPSPKFQVYELIVELVVAFGVLVLVNVTTGEVKQIVFAETVKLAVGAGVLLTVTDKLELLKEVPQALLA